MTRMQKSTPLIYPILFLFLLITAAILILKTKLLAWGFDSNLLLIANTGLFLLTLLVFVLQFRSANSGNPNRFVQAVMGGTLIKMIVFATAILIYTRSVKDISRISVYVALGFYLLYLVVEVVMMNRMNKRKNA
jgi:hypothetical protein